MSLPVFITTDAQADIDDAHVWYEAHQPGRGDDFLNELRDRLDDIGRTPDLYGRVDRRTRAAPLPASQFVVYYRVEPNRVRVIAVQHARANPRSWQRRK